MSDSATASSAIPIASKVPTPECTSSTADVVVNGLHLFENFVTTEQEEELLSGICGSTANWEHSMKRRVQHYGFKFNYRTLLLDYATETEPIPSQLKPMIDQIVDMYNTHIVGVEVDASTARMSPEEINQLTLNEYEPGQGIASHVDNDACFGDTVFIISLGAGITMTFRNKFEAPSSCISDSTGFNNINSINSSSSSSNEVMKKKHVYLPPRSLIILTKDARHLWTHGISSRTSDKVDGIIIDRGRRVSLTFRQAVKPGNIPSTGLLANEVEKDHVFRVYNNIAVHWNHTRGKRKVHWHLVKDFLEQLPPGSLLADVGSGDGKYFGLNPNVTVIGCDRSLKLLQVSKENSHETFCCDAVLLPFRSNSFDAAICIAVLHHLASVDRRCAVIRELVRITAPGGTIMVQAWAQEQEEDSRHDFSSQQDVLVPWKLQKRFFDTDQNNKYSSDSVVSASACASASASAATVSENINLNKKKKPRKGKAKKRAAVEAYLQAQQQHQQEEMHAEQLQQEESCEGTNDAIEGQREEGDAEAAATEDLDNKEREVGSTESQKKASESELTTNPTSEEVQSALHSLTISNESTVSTADVADSNPSKGSNSSIDVDIDGECQHAVEENNQVVFQRYCHVYKKGELEDLCSSVPNCRVMESGWEKGNWFVKLLKVSDERLLCSQFGPERSVKELQTRTLKDSAVRSINTSTTTTSTTASSINSDK